MYDEAEWWVYLLTRHDGPSVSFWDDGTVQGVELREVVFRPAKPSSVLP